LQIASRLLGQVGLLGGIFGGAAGSPTAALAGTGLGGLMLGTELGASHLGGRAAAASLGPHAGFLKKVPAYFGAYRGVPTYMAAATGPVLALATRSLLDRPR
jgi:hypothetical protein